jgi:hypothetical protein
VGAERVSACLLPMLMHVFCEILKFHKKTVTLGHRRENFFSLLKINDVIKEFYRYADDFSSHYGNEDEKELKEGGSAGSSRKKDEVQFNVHNYISCGIAVHCNTFGAN